MEKIVTDILKAEETAKKVVEEAREQAEKLKNQVELEVTDKLKSAREQAQAYIKEGVLKAREEADNSYQNMVKSAETDNAAFIKEHSTGIDALVQQVAALVTAPEFDRE